MTFREILPCDALKPYIKSFYIYESLSDRTFSDTVVPSGSTELVFNLGSGSWQIANGENTYTNNPAIEFWGQIIKPLSIRSLGKNTMLGVRFLPHGAAPFINDNFDQFNNRVVDFSDVCGRDVSDLHQELLNFPSWNNRITRLENFLLTRLPHASRRTNKIAVVTDVMSELNKEDFFDNIENVASRYGITSRYLQKLFLQYTGLTPKLYTKIHRFQSSLALVAQKEAPLTSIAYDCGYFDQSHFIRDFKAFTGTTPSDYALDDSSLTFAFVNS
jgi:AraC-like DNA-binding protein